MGELYLEAVDLCRQGHLCVAVLVRLHMKLQQEQNTLRKKPPGTNRVQQGLAFNKMITCWLSSFAQEELMAHTKYSQMFNSRTFSPPAAPRVDVTIIKTAFTRGE